MSHMSQVEERAGSGFRYFVVGVLLLAVVYPLSVAPVQYLQSHGYLGGGEWFELAVYGPLVAVLVRCPEAVIDQFAWYAELFVDGPEYAVPYRTHGGVI